MKTQTIRLTLLVLVISVSMLNTSFSAEKKKGFVTIAGMEITPKLTISGKYSTNVFSEADLGDRNNNSIDDPDENEDDDFIISITPGVDVVYPGENVSFDFGYTLDGRTFTDFSDEDHLHQNLSAKINFLTPSQRYKFTLGGNFVDTRDPASDDFQSERDFFSAERTRFRYYGIFDLLFGRHSNIVFDLSRTINEYDSSELDDEDTETTQFGVEYRHKFWEKTSALFGYNYSTLEYPNNERDAVRPEDDLDNDGNLDPGERAVFRNSDSDNHGFNLGLQWDATAKLTGRATVGWTSRSYDENAFAGGDDESTFTFGTALVWNARERTKVNFSLQRSLHDAAFANSAFVTTTSLGLGVTQNIGRKMVGQLNGVYSLSDYDDDVAQSREDDKITISSSLRYDILDWLFGKVGYNFQNNSSDIDDREYLVHELLFTVGTKF